MSFVDLPDGTGKIYVPEQKEGGRKKNPCPDCFSCRMCSDERCERCLCQGKRNECSCREGETEARSKEENMLP